LNREVIEDVGAPPRAALEQANPILPNSPEKAATEILMYMQGREYARARPILKMHLQQLPLDPHHGIWSNAVLGAAIDPHHPVTGFSIAQRGLPA
jgi:hypothetical protein